FNIAFLPMHLTGLVGMPRRVFTYSGAHPFELLNLVSTVGAFVLAAGFALIVVDALWLVRRRPRSPRDPWQAGTLEWLAEMPSKPWGVRSIPVVETRYPLWDQPNLMRDVDAGRFYLADAPEGRRETLVTSPVDAVPEQCLRVPGPTFMTLWAALFTGGAFILPVFKLYAAAAVSGVLAVVAIIVWVWTGTAIRPEKPAKDVGGGLTLPLYASGQVSVGWWGMFITMIGDMTAFASLVFGYFFFWTIHDYFPPAASSGPGLLCPLVAWRFGLAVWRATLLARRYTLRSRGVPGSAETWWGSPFAQHGVYASLPGTRGHAMDPSRHEYDATVWLLTGGT